MPNELKNTLLRVTSTYGRLFFGVLLGVLVVRLLLHAIGNEGFGLVALLGQTVGFGGMIYEIVRQSMIRELGASYHDSNANQFPLAITAAMVISMALTLVAVAIYTGLFFLVPVFEIPPDLVWAARWFIVAKAVELSLMTLFAPQINMYLIAERMVAYNLWMLSQRVAQATAAGWLVWRGDAISTGEGLVFFGIVSAGGVILALTIMVGWMAWTTPTTIPRIQRVPWSVMRPFIVVGGWNAAVIGANNLHLRLHAIIMNLYFGLFGNRIFGLAVQLAAYVRMIAEGTTLGVDAVTTRIQASHADEGVVRFIRHATRLTAFVTLPACFAVFILAEPILRVWVGSLLDDPAHELPRAAALVRCLAVGTVVWGLGDCWTRILYGSGNIRVYAPLLVINGVLNPAVALLLVNVLPEPIRYLGPAITFSGLFAITMMIGVPLTVSRCLKLRLRDVYIPLIRPGLVTLLCAPLLLLGQLAPQWNLLWLAVTFAVYGGTYFVVGWFVSLDTEERIRIKTAFNRRFAAAATTDEVDQL